MSSLQLLPSLVDETAANEPSCVLYSISKTKNPADGFTDISVRAFAHAVDRCAWFIDDALGRGTHFPTLLYIGPQDIVYPILTLASVKSGYKVLFSSPRNSLEAHLSLLDKTDCHTFLMPPGFPLPVVKDILAARPMRVLHIASPSTWLDGSHRPYHYNKTFAEAKYEPFVVLHTSGSTGLPKPIIQTHATAAAMQAYTRVPDPASTFPNMLTGKRLYTAFPLFHCAGLRLTLPCAVYAQFTVVLGPFPPSPDVINAVHAHGNVQGSALAPASWVDVVKVPEYLDNLSRLDLAISGGGPLQNPTGDLFSAKTRLLNIVGTTELGPLPTQLCSPDSWGYMRFSPVLGAEYRHVAGELYEQVIVRGSRPEYQGVFGTYPELQEWRMKDLYAKHHIEENAWLYKGRADDILVLGTGEKINPLDMESMVSSNPSVVGALVTGAGRMQASLLVEPAKQPTTDEERQRLLEGIWPSVQAANIEAASHGRIHRNMILFTASDKPMLRAGKGTVQRRLTVELYERELDSLYEAQALGIVSGVQHDENLPSIIRRLLIETTDILDDVLEYDADFFELGMDSLQVTMLAKRINDVLVGRGAKRMLTPRCIYGSPSLSSLAHTVASLLNETPEQTVKSTIERMKELYEANVNDMPISGRQPPSRTSSGAVVLLTGSTASLGSYILDALESNPAVSHIYCLNRGQYSRQRQEESQSAKGLPPLNNKVQCLDANLSESHFGLPPSDYRCLLTAVTDVIHNAWPVDFNMSIDSFARQIDIVRRLVNFSSQSTFGANIIFISSFSAASGLAGDVEEQTFSAWDVAPENGYGQSKHVAKRILEIAAAEAQVSVAICRVGQVAGPTGHAGMWPKQEWLPSLIASSKHLGMLPDSLGRMETVDWIPVDVLARIICEIMINTAGESNSAAAVYHATNPQNGTWKSLVPAVAGVLDVKVVSLEKWLDALRRSAMAENLLQNPALKLLDFFEGLISFRDRNVALSTKQTVNVAPSLAGLKPVDKVLMANWMTQWAF